MANKINSVKHNTSAVQPAVVVDAARVLSPDLMERRKFVRPVPAPEAIECHDEASWSAWKELATLHDQEAESASALAKLRLLQNRAGTA